MCFILFHWIRGTWIRLRLIEQIEYSVLFGSISLCGLFCFYSHSMLSKTQYKESNLASSALYLQFNFIGLISFICFILFFYFVYFKCFFSFYFAFIFFFLAYFGPFPSFVIFLFYLLLVILVFGSLFYLTSPLLLCSSLFILSLSSPLFINGYYIPYFLFGASLSLVLDFIIYFDRSPLLFSLVYFVLFLLLTGFALCYLLYFLYYW